MTVWLGVIGGIVGLIAAVAAAVAVVRANLASATIATYKEDNEALRGRIDTLHAEDRIKTGALAKCEGRITALEKENAALVDLVTGKSAVEHLERTVIAQHVDVLNGFDKMVEALAVIAATGKLRNPRAGE